MSVKILVGDCRKRLRGLPDRSVHSCVTSPPYWAQRDYDHVDQLGRETSLQEHIDELVSVFREVRRVLRDDGTLWINYGDAWATKGYSAKPIPDAHLKPANWSSDRRGQSVLSTVGDGIKEKDLIGAPWALAFALRADGWWLRDCIIWAKENPPPTSVQDRTCPAHEYVFMLSKSPRYFYDNLAIEEPLAESSKARYAQTTLETQQGGVKQQLYKDSGARSNSRSPSDLVKAQAASGKDTRKKRSVWSIPVKGFDEAHFATFPPALIEPCILASAAPKVCSTCGSPWLRRIERTEEERDFKGSSFTAGKTAVPERGCDRAQQGPRFKVRDLGHHPACECGSPSTNAVILDPFGGAGTTAIVADRLQRDAILIEINPDYAEMARARVSRDAPLLQEVEVL